MFPRFATRRWQRPATLALLLAAPLILIACGETRRPIPTQTPTLLKTEPADTARAPRDAVPGEQLRLACSPAMPCEVEFQVDEIRVTDTCENGRAEFHSPLGEDQLLITIEGEATAVRTTHDQHFHTFRRPGFADATGPIAGAGVTSPCTPAELPHWTHPLPEGETRHLSQTWAMPSQAKYVVLGRHRFEVPQPG